MEKETAYKHELVVPNEDLPFKLFVFEGKEGNYVRNLKRDIMKIFYLIV